MTFRFEGGKVQRIERPPQKEEGSFLEPSIVTIGKRIQGRKNLFLIRENGKGDYVFIEQYPEDLYDGAQVRFIPYTTELTPVGEGEETILARVGTVEVLNRRAVPLPERTYKENRIALEEAIGAFAGTPVKTESTELWDQDLFGSPSTQEPKGVTPEALDVSKDEQPPSIEQRPSSLKMPRYATGVIMDGSPDDETQLYIQVDQARGYTLPQRLPLTTIGSKGQLVLLSSDIGPGGEAVWTVERPLGRADDFKSSMESLVYRTGRALEFPETVEREVGAIQADLDSLGEEAFIEREAKRSHYEYPGGPKAEEIKLVSDFKDYVHGETRLDLRKFPGMRVFGIDPEDAKDHDDLVSCEILEDGSIRYGIHIANVDHYAYPGTALDRESEERQMTLYLPGIVSPVYPELLSANLCSLKPKVPRIAESVIFTLHPDGRRTVWHGSTIVQSEAQFAYEAADKALDDETHELHEALRTLKEISNTVREERGERGAIVFPEEQETRLVPDSKGGIRVQRRSRGPSSFMIEDLMLEANRAVGEVLVEDEVPGTSVVFERINTPPPLDRLMRLVRDMRAFDLRFQARHDIPGDPETAAYARRYQDAISRSENDPERERILTLLDAERNDIVNHIHSRNANTTNALAMGFAEKMRDALRKISPPAKYSLDRDVGHASLKLKPYVHFTSDMRRKPDTHVKRLRDAKLSVRPVTYENEVVVEALEESAARTNLVDGLISQAERDARHIGALHLLARQTQGFRFENVKIEGDAPRGRGVLVSLPLGQGYTHRFTIPWRALVGTDTPGLSEGREFEPGTLVHLAFEAVDFEKREATFSYAGKPEAQPRRRAPERREQQRPKSRRKS